MWVIIDSFPFSERLKIINITIDVYKDITLEKGY